MFMCIISDRTTAAAELPQFLQEVANYPDSHPRMTFLGPMVSAVSIAVGGMGMWGIGGHIFQSLSAQQHTLLGVFPLLEGTKLSEHISLDIHGAGDINFAISS